jgi:hypothetical protein
MNALLTDNPQKLFISLLVTGCEYKKQRPRIADCLNFKQHKHCSINNLPFYRTLDFANSDTSGRRTALVVETPALNAR